MTKLEMLNNLKLNLNKKNITFKEVIPNKMLEIKNQALQNSKIEMKISCEKDEYDVYLKLHVNDDCLGLFETNSATEFTSVVKLANTIKSVIDFESEYWEC